MTPTRLTQHGPNTSSALQMLTESVAKNPVQQRAVGRLEPCAGKLACTVLRGADNSNVVGLLDFAFVGRSLPEEIKISLPTIE